ncbi:MAG: tRNA pseudouridine(38-40) synthase TruA [bacterium]
MSPEDLRRLVLWIEYDGTDFHGWQAQPGQRTVQVEIETVLGRMCAEPVRLIASGRTDAGVHAEGQVAHFNTSSSIPAFKFRLGLNTLLERDISILDCREARAPFHAQYDALRKTYRYRILRRRAPSALRRSRVWHLKAPLDVGRMREAAAGLLGEHDFASFCAEGGNSASTVRRLELLEVREEGEEIVIEAASAGFLRHMVRNLVSTLVEVGRGDRAPESMGALLAARDRTLAGPTAPPQGLCLMGVEYGDKTPPPAEEPGGEEEPSG